MSIKENIEAINKNNKIIEQNRPIDPKIMNKVTQKLRLNFNYHSNKIEGNSLTIQETRSLLMNSLTPNESKPLQDIEEMRAHIETVDKLGLLESVVKDQTPITEKLIKEINTLILVRDHKKKVYDNKGNPIWVDVIVGKYKHNPNHVITATGEKFLFAEPGEITKALMHDLFEWYNESKEKYHPIELAAIFHYKFIRIHPFDDGNGRVARIIMNLILQNHGFPIAIIPSNTEKKDIYYRSLMNTDANIPDLDLAVTISDSHIFSPFVEYISSQVLYTSDLLVNAVKGNEIFDVDDVIKQYESSIQDVKEFDSEKRYQQIISNTQNIINTIDKLLVVFVRHNYESLAVGQNAINYSVSGQTYNRILINGFSREQPDIYNYSVDLSNIKQAIEKDLHQHASSIPEVVEQKLKYTSVGSINVNYSLIRAFSNTKKSITVSILILEKITNIDVNMPGRSFGKISFDTNNWQEVDWVQKLRDLLENTK